ncbi:hypothetical protein BOX15_Mlig013121g5 [Macrostomum lignano]|uniref:Vacuolar ATPase assembly integral membrane protein VMA21 homolog n=1 Tax=Macrostomum lignano TaxID=282301 RepID=A0A267DGB1_9PLAT|nr:hypothetical protein BOX15_Mlig013121g5 [Macrostomum lignano]
MDVTNLGKPLLGTAAAISAGTEGDSHLSITAKALTTLSLLLIFLPITLYFFAKSLVFEGLFLLSSRQSYIYSAILAVVTVHVLLAGFLLFAFYEGGRTVYVSYKRD